MTRAVQPGSNNRRAARASESPNMPATQLEKVLDRLRTLATTQQCRDVHDSGCSARSFAGGRNRARVLFLAKHFLRRFSAPAAKHLPELSCLVFSTKGHG